MHNLTEPIFSVDECNEGALVILENSAELDLKTCARAWIGKIASMRVTYPTSKYDLAEISSEERRNPGVIHEESILTSVVFLKKV